MEKSDPVGPEFYSPLVVAERISTAAFYIGAILSVAVLLINKATRPDIFVVVQVAFAVSVVILFVSEIVVQVYFSVRAHTQRLADFVSNAFGVPIVSQPSRGYYNSKAENTFLRLGALVLENSLFTKSICKKMLHFERAQIAIYGVVWFSAMFSRGTDIELLTVAAQVLLSEKILSRWVRMEWLRSRVERIYDDVYALIQSTADYDSSEFRARVIEAVIRYETSKAQAGISMSSRIFNRLNSSLSSQWEAISIQFGISPENQSRDTTHSR